MVAQNVMDSELIIRPKKAFSLNMKELFAYRELFLTLAQRDIKVRYKQTAIGILWAVLQPLILMVVFSVFFGKIAGISSGSTPYPIFVYSGLLFWDFFSNSLNASSGSLVSNQAIIQKIYFPRLIIPVASTLVFLLDFIFSGIIFIGLLIYYGSTPSIIGISMVIPALVITFLTSLGIGLFFAALNVKYRDVRYVLPFFIQILLFVTPVIYPPSVLGKFQWLWYLNPMSGVIDTMRSGLLGIGLINWHLFASAGAVSIVLFAIGLLYFNKTEKYFADIV